MMKTIRLLFKCVLALFHLRDIETFWLLRTQILQGSRLAKLWELFIIIIRRHYGCGVPICPGVNPFSVVHGFYGIFIASEAFIGKNCTIMQHVTIGSTSLVGKEGGAPCIGDDCFIGAGAIIVGNVKIGNRVKIGAGAVVAQDVPDNCTVVMEKPRIITH